MTDQESVEAFATIGRMLGALHTAMVEFGMRRDDANMITAAVIRKLIDAGKKSDDDGK